MSAVRASTPKSPSKTARRNAQRLVNQARDLADWLLPPDRWEPKKRDLREFLRHGGFEEFLHLYMTAIALDPEEPSYPWNLASALRRLGRPELALAFVGHAIAIGERQQDPDRSGPDEYLVWAETAAHARQQDVAFLALATALEKAPDDEEVIQAAARCLEILREQHAEDRTDAVWNPRVWRPLCGTQAASAAEARHDDLLRRLVGRTPA